jgi:glycosyltransferase involved in cell wall biosynthesis
VGAVVPTNSTTRSGPPPAAPGLISYITSGSLSGINESLLPLLAAHFPDLETSRFDAAAWLRSSRRLQLECVVRVLAEAGPRALLGHARLAATVWRSAYLNRRIRRELAARDAAGGRVVFSLQTQSLFDAGLDGIPHFLYTDHTAMANSYYPDFEPEEGDPSWVERERLIYEDARLVFTMSGHVSRSLEEHYGIDPARIRCVYGGSNVTPLPRRPGAEASQRILFVGRDWKRKGGPQLLAALAQVRERHPDARLSVVGCDPGAVPEGVDVVGNVPYHRVAELFAESAVFCMPTRREPFGLAFVEALTGSVPVVASDIGALPEIVQDGETGFLVGPDDVDGLAAALVAVLDDPERARRFGELGAERMRARYTWGHAADAIAAEIKDSLGAQR